MESQALGLLDRVRRACREVVARARQVVIRDELLRQLAESLSPEDLALPELDPTCHWLGHGADTAAFMLMLEAVNFGSGYFPDLRPHRGRQGYFAVAGALYDRFADVGVPTAEELTTWSAEHCAQVFGQDPTSPAARRKSRPSAVRGSGLRMRFLPPRPAAAPAPLLPN
ncbi:MAG TPA: hypothetical protein PK413_18830, partial [Thermoanaerobaculia bacterium]|nr:hypothetical protein [Thermoanaerobaculia bacterium]